MFFEIEMYKDFINGMVNLLETIENKENLFKEPCSLTKNDLDIKLWVDYIYLDVEERRRFIQWPSNPNEFFLWVC